MRAAIRAYLASHPLLAFTLVILRWTAWFAAGHLVGLVAGAWALIAGAPLPAAALIALLLDFGANRLAAVTDGWFGRRYRVCILAARFQRRWPAAFAEASQQRPHDRPVIMSGRYFAAPDGLRPALVAPRIRIKPLSINEDTATWEVHPWTAQGFGEFSADVDLVAIADDRVLVADVAPQPPSRRRRWNLTVRFFEPAQGIDPADGAITVDGRMMPGATTNGSRWKRRPGPLTDGGSDNDKGEDKNKDKNKDKDNDRVKGRGQGRSTGRSPDNTDQIPDQGQSYSTEI